VSESGSPQAKYAGLNIVGDRALVERIGMPYDRKATSDRAKTGKTASQMSESVQVAATMSHTWEIEDLMFRQKQEH
jgi:hypothetical protein